MTVGPLHVESLESDAPLAAELRRAFDMLRAGSFRHGAIVLPGETRPGRDMVELVIQELGRTPLLVGLALVHPHPALGFLTSSIGLRATGVRVIAYADLATARVKAAAELTASGR